MQDINVHLSYLVRKQNMIHFYHNGTQSIMFDKLLEEISF